VDPFRGAEPIDLNPQFRQRLLDDQRSPFDRTTTTVTFDTPPASTVTPGSSSAPIRPVSRK
jgi:hypothetical protein